MPSTAARRYHEDQIPPFMSVFDLDAETMADRDTVTVVDPRAMDGYSKQPLLQHAPQQLGHGLVPTDPSHKHNDSSSTQMSESADSSPTTTLSTTDSSPLSDPSPSSSPDSPVTLVPLNNYPATSFGAPAARLEPVTMLKPLEPYTLVRPMTSPSPRRARNMKGLSIQPPSLGNAAGPVATAATNNTIGTEPPSPSFIKPKIPGMKRKPSMLSLKTNTSDLMGRPIPEVPPSPGMGPMLQRRALKHSTSSPHMLTTIKSASFGPAGGMTLPNMLCRNENGLSEVLRPMKTSMQTTFDTTIKEESSPIKSQVAHRMDAEPYHEKVNNEDQKTPGYPDGPIAIYDDDVYLYLEPTAEEAARFDVVFNVAKEVPNPFEAEAAKKRQSFVESPVPDTALTNASFATAFEFQPGNDRSHDTPTTPKANPWKMPEYVHMPWDHNTDIAPDLMQLCKKIEERTREGKKVLIHCQQGASRSASLIIAYGLYRQPNLTVNDAYYAAQKKSQWISPNMKLMYSLQDFHKEVSKKLPLGPTRAGKGRSPTKHRLTLSADAIGLPMKEPRTAPLPREKGREARGQHLTPIDTHRRGYSMPGTQDVSPGPATAPPNYSWPDDMVPTPVEEAASPIPALQVSELPQRPKQLELAAPPRASFEPPPTPGFGAPGGFAFQNKTFPRFSNMARLLQQPAEMDWQEPCAPPTRAAPAPPPPANTYGSIDQTMTSPPDLPVDDAILSPRAETMTKNPLHDFPASASGMQFVETPPTPKEGLFSPRVTCFPRDPMVSFGRPPQVADPRSPPIVGETPIVRSIDDIL